MERWFVRLFAQKNAPVLTELRHVMIDNDGDDAVDVVAMMMLVMMMLVMMMVMMMVRMMMMPMMMMISLTSYSNTVVPDSTPTFV